MDKKNIIEFNMHHLQKKIDKVQYSYGTAGVIQW